MRQIIFQPPNQPLPPGLFPQNMGGTPLINEGKVLGTRLPPNAFLFSKVEFFVHSVQIDARGPQIKSQLVFMFLFKSSVFGNFSSWNSRMLRLNSVMLMMIIVFRRLLPKAPVVFQLLENNQKKIVLKMCFMVHLGWNHFCIGIDFCWISLHDYFLVRTRILRFHPNCFVLFCLPKIKQIKLNLITLTLMARKPKRSHRADKESRYSACIKQENSLIDMPTAALCWIINP